VENTVALAIVDVEEAFLQLEFAIKLMCYCEFDHLDRAAFDTDVVLRLETKNVRFPTGNFATYESVIVASHRQVSISFGVSAIALDAAYEATGVGKNLKMRSPVDDLRILVFMVRNAFAHNMAFPCWKVRGEDYARPFSLPLDGSSATVDLSTRDGEIFDYSHIGGFDQWFKIKKAVIDVVGAT
jgi:hypothetical protein